MDNKKFLNEERYQKSKKKLIILAILILMIGLSIGGYLITSGIEKFKQIKLSDEEINQIETQIDDYNTQLASLKAQKSQEFSNNGKSEIYYNLENQIDKINKNIEKLEDKLEQDTFDVFPLCMFGGFAILASLIISFSIYSTAKGREISAFYVQQQMPIAKEGINEIAPTIGNAAGEIAKGIKKGLDDE